MPGLNEASVALAHCLARASMHIPLWSKMQNRAISVFGLSGSPGPAALLLQRPKGLCPDIGHDGGTGRDHFSCTWLSVCAKQTSKLQMGNSLRRLFIREVWKPLVPNKVRCALGFVSMGFCCYWYSDQISPFPASALNFSWDIKCIKSLLPKD